MSDRLSEIEARLAAATPGPWEADVFPVRKRSRKTGRVLAYRPEDGSVGSVSVIPSDGMYGVMDGPDAELIAHAPADLAALVAVVKATRDLRDRVEGSPFEALTVGSVVRSLDAALSKLEAS